MGNCTTCPSPPRQYQFDDRRGLSGLRAEMSDRQPTLEARAADLQAIDKGELVPDPGSRLGAYAATAGYPAGSVGSAAHRAIGAIYMAAGTFGEERIGTVFNSEEAKALFPQSVNSPASKQLATVEYNYWAAARADDPWSAGGNMGSAFNPTWRDRIQWVTGNTPLPDWRNAPSPPRVGPLASPAPRTPATTGDWVKRVTSPIGNLFW